MASYVPHADSALCPQSATSHYSSSLTRTTGGGGDPLASLSAAEGMLSQSSQRVEKTVTMTNTSRTYRSGQT